MDEHEHHIVGPRVFGPILLALMVLLLVTFLAATTNIGPDGVLNLPIALLIAITKAVLIILFFMHIKYSSYMTIIAACAGFFWLCVLLILTFNDFLTRELASPFSG